MRKHVIPTGLALMATSVVAGAATAKAPRTTSHPALPALVVTQLPIGTAAERDGARAGGILAAHYSDGARLIIVRSGRIMKVLTPDFASAADPDVSFDGESIVFAGKKQAGDRWAIYEMNVDGSGVRRVTQDDADDARSPFYMPTVYTIIKDPTKGTEPREQIGFVRHFRDRLNEAGTGMTSGLFSCRRDGRDEQRLTLNLSNEMDPVVLPDGRIVYASWQRATLERGYLGRVSLLSVNADGSDPMIYTADEGRRFKTMPCVTADGLVVFVENEALEGDGSGALAAVTLRRNLHSHRAITRDSDGYYRAPSPLPDGQVLAAWRSRDREGTYGIVRVDPRSGNREVVFDDPAYHEVQARLVAPRPATDQRSSSVRDPDEASGHDAAPHVEGKLYGLNVYLNDLGVALPPGTIKHLRVIEGLASHKTEELPVEGIVPRVPGASRKGLPPIAKRRLLGEAPIENDGSFHVIVPADVPIQVQILDADGLALRSSGWLWIHNRIQQGCIGCHEDAELTPPNRFADALKKPGVRLTLPPEKRRSLDFRRDVMPIVERRCVSCHGEGKAVRLDGGVDASGASGIFNRAYETLLAGLATSPDGSIKGKYVDPGRARTSPLIWHIFGRNTARPWDKDAGSRQYAPSKAVLSEEEKRIFVEWIDLGALWEGASDLGSRNESARGAP
jgi:hypothetical protein